MFACTKHEPNILNNGGKKISNYIMCVLVCYPPQAQQNKCIPIGSMGWPHMHRERPHVVGWERPNMMCNIEENKKMVWLGGQKINHSSLGLCKISIERNDNLKIILKWCWKMSVHAHFLRCYPENDLFFLNNYSNKGMEIWTTRGRKPWTHLKWAWNGNGTKWLAPITPN